MGQVQAVIFKFGKMQSCWVWPIGEPQLGYSAEQVQWIERPEDEYGGTKPEPSCKVMAEDFRKGSEVERNPHGMLGVLQTREYVMLHSGPLFPGGEAGDGVIWPEIEDKSFRQRCQELFGDQVKFLPPDELDDTWACKLV